MVIQFLYSEMFVFHGIMASLRNLVYLFILSYLSYIVT